MRCSPVSFWVIADNKDLSCRLSVGHGDYLKAIWAMGRQPHYGDKKIVRAHHVSRSATNTFGVC